MEHKHAEVLRAIADGKEVEWQFKDCNGCWHEMNDTYNPIAMPEIEWRVKPEAKPDYCFYFGYDYRNGAGTVFDCPPQCPWKYVVKITIDGETNEPKSVELVK